jgi:hypothetical protein
MGLLWKRQIWLAVAVGFGTSCGAALANDVYIAQTSAGSANGNSCGNAYAVSYFNASGNWGSGASQIGPGTVVHLCGTITTNLTVNGSGSAGSVIEILFESGANITQPTCNGSCLNLGSYGYILVDGGASKPCGWNVATNASEGICNGFIQNTANGQGQANNNPDIGIYVGGSNIEIRNIGIYNMWVPSGGSNSQPSNDPTCLQLDQTGTAAFSFHDSVCHDAADGFNNVHESSSSGYSIYNNYVYDINHAIGGAADGTTSNVNIYGNRFSNFAVWLPITSYHHDGIYLWCDAFTNACGTLSNWNVYNNLWNGTFGTGVTSYFYIDNTLATNNVNVFNNVFAPSDAQSVGGSGYTAMYPAGSSNYNLYNNSYVIQNGSAVGCHEGGSNGSALTIQFENNLFQNCPGAVVAYTPITYSPVNYNVYATCASSSGSNCWYFNHAEVGFSTWQSDAGGEGKSVYYASTNANLNTNYVPQSGSVAIGAGTNLYNVCNGQPNPGLGALCYDAAGNPRPSSGAWTVGAYSSPGGSSTGSNPPAVPTNLIATAQ